MKQMMEAYDQWKKKPTRSGMAHVLQSAKPVIDMAIRSYVGAQDPVAYSQAKLLAMKAIKAYDPSKGTKLRTHMLTQLQPLRRLAAKRRFVSHVPEQIQYDMSGLTQAEADLTDEFGREPTEAEVSDRTGLNIKRIKKIRQMSVPQHESSFGQEGPPQVDEHKPMDEWQDYVYYDLSPADKKIFEWRTGYNGKPVLGVSEISKKLNMSAPRVTQRANNISIKLEEGLDFVRRP